MSLDPKAELYPNESPFLFGGNNPIYFIDPTGGFKVPIHKDIIWDALGLIFPKNSTFLGRAFMGDLVTGAGEFTDWGHPLSDRDHFDGMDYEQIQSNWTRINQDIDNIDIGGVNMQFGGYDTWQLGKRLHSVQDFYSHSNYVELYIAHYRSKNNDKLPAIGEIPTYDEVIANTEKYGEFINGSLKTKLHTGKFGGTKYVLNKNKDINDTHANGDDHHDDLAKDNLSMGKIIKNKNGDAINTHKAARDVATRHTAKIIRKKIGK